MPSLFLTKGALLMVSMLSMASMYIVSSGAVLRAAESKSTVMSALYQLTNIQVANNAVIQAGHKRHKEVWTETAGPIFSMTHWDYYVRSYISQDADRYVRNYDNVLEADEQRELGEEVDVIYEAYDVGTVLAKSHFTNEGDDEPEQITYMIKEKSGFDPKYNNWRYVQIKKGKTTLDGNSHDKPVYNQCIKCHSNVRNRDFIYNYYLNESLRNLMASD